MKFYVLNRFPHGRDVPCYTSFVHAEHSNFGSEAPKCAECGRFTGMLPWLPPYRVELEAWGPEYGDYVRGLLPSFLISECLQSLIEENGVSEITSIDPVEVVSVQKHRRVKGVIPQYYLATACHDGAMIDEAQSGFKRAGHPICPACRGGDVVFRYRRLIVQDKTWNGSDIFVSGDASAILVTDRIKCLSESAGLKFLVFVPAESELAGLDWYPQRNMKRAQELMSLPLSENLLEKRLRDGRLVRYYCPINEIVIKNVDGTLALDRPFSGKGFWDSLK